MLADVLKHYRKGKKLTIEALAKEIGIPMPSYYRVERNMNVERMVMTKILLWILHEPLPLTPTWKRKDEQ